MKSQDNNKRIAELNLQRQKEMTADTAKLLDLANELRAQTETAGKGAVSMDEVRKVEEIAKLAHGVREKMKATSGN